MKNRKQVTAKLALALVFGALTSAVQADSRYGKNPFVRVSEFEGHIVFCAGQNPPVDVQVLPNGVEIVTFINIGNVWLTDNPLVDGVEENKVVATFDPASPGFTARIKGKVDVAAVDGTWRFWQRLTVTPDNESGTGFGVGTGDLSGSFIITESGPVEPVEDSPCDVPFGAPMAGKVISFGWRL